MVDYVEDPINRIVGVHWQDDDDETPPDDGDGQTFDYQGEYEYGYIAWTDDLFMAPTGPDPDPFIVNQPDAHPGYDPSLRYTQRIFIGPTNNGLYDASTGRPFPDIGINFVGPPGLPTARFFVTAPVITITITRSLISNSGESPMGYDRFGTQVGIIAPLYWGVVHSDGPPDPVTHQAMQPLAPTLDVAQPILMDQVSTFQWTYYYDGALLPGNPTYTYDWTKYNGVYAPEADPTRFDPRVGGALEILTMRGYQYSGGVYTSWIREEGGFMGGNLGQTLTGLFFMPDGGSPIWSGCYYKVKFKAHRPPPYAPYPPNLVRPGFIILDSDPQPPLIPIGPSGQYGRLVPSARLGRLRL